MSCFPVFARAVRLQISNVSARNRLTVGVQSPPTLPAMVDHIERRKVTTSSGASPGRYYRKAYYWSGDKKKLNQAKAIL
jgi:hypothetical protein